MFEATADALILQARTQIAADATWQGIVGRDNAAARVHYPLIDLSGKDGAKDPVPACLITRLKPGRSKYAEGAGGLISGTLELLFFFPALDGAGVSAAYGVGSIERLVDAIANGLIAQRAGIPFSGTAVTEEATDPTNAAAAVTVDGASCAYRTCRTTLPYGYHA